MSDFLPDPGNYRMKENPSKPVQLNDNQENLEKIEKLPSGGIEANKEQLEQESIETLRRAMALKNDVGAAKEVLDRIHGKAAQAIDVKATLTKRIQLVIELGGQQTLIESGEVSGQPKEQTLLSAPLIENVDIDT